MKLQISQLSEGENPFHFNSEKDEWIKEFIRSLGQKGYKLEGRMDVDLSLTKLDPDYYLKGQLTLKVQQTCARCVESFGLALVQPFAMALAHLKSLKSRDPKLEEESEELDINFFEGREINLGPLIEEQFVLSLPYQPLCKPDCKGICQQCGENLNRSGCQCQISNPTNPFSVLKQLKH